VAQGKSLGLTHDLGKVSEENLSLKKRLKDLEAIHQELWVKHEASNKVLQRQEACLASQVFCDMRVCLGWG
jgi:hypothetical protein